MHAVVESFAVWDGPAAYRACWWGDGLPRRRRVAGLERCPATLGLNTAQTPTGRQQWEYCTMGTKPDAATPRGDDGLPGL